MFDLHKALFTFYENHVRLGKERREELARHRDTCIDRLKDGLRRLGEQRRQKYPCFERPHTQGSYAMSTLNQHPKQEYDIDVAVIFRKEALPTTALKARQLVAAALRATLNNFATKPLARTNAVTTWYTQGHHVDLAVYREFTDDAGHVVQEHASSDWVRRNPQEVTDWFNLQVKRLSPTREQGATVPEPEVQFRRVVRLVKVFARSRLSWQPPGGMILSTLVAEVYKPDPHRDDVALYNTLVALRERVRANPEVESPVRSGDMLTRKREVRSQMRRLLQKLDLVLPQLDVLKDPACLLPQALRAWGQVFNHDYWREAARKAALAAMTEPAKLRVKAELATHKGGSITSRYGDSAVALARGIWLRFSLKKRLDIKPPFTVRWMVRNGGSEARAASDTEQVHAGDARELWLITQYEGQHSVTCELIQDGQVVARGSRQVRVASK